MKRLADQTLYEILEVPPDASPEQIHAAYERARSLYGPGSLVTYTLIEPDEAALLEGRIEDARVTLLDAERRARYDEALERQRVAEPRAAASGAALSPGGSPPVIPAAPPPATGWGAAPPPAEPGPGPAILLGSAAAPAPAGPAGAGGPPPTPIRLEREVAPEPPAAEPAAPRAAGGAQAPPAAEPAAPRAAGGAPAPPAAEPEAPRAAGGAQAPPAAAPAAPGALPPAPLPDAWTGEALRQVRESRGISVQQIAEKTKVTRYHIENIEADRFAALPAQVYLRGILLSIARELRLDGQRVARSYLERLPAAGGAPPPKPR